MKRRTLIAALCLRLLLAAALPDKGGAAEPAPPIHVSLDAKVVSLADSLFDAGAYQSAAPYFERIVSVIPHDAESLYRLAVCHHANGEYDNAIRLYRLASAYPENRAYSLYNMACALSLSDQTDDALQALHNAIEAGFVDGNSLLHDSDLDALRADERFRTVLLRAFGEGYTGFDGPGPTPEQRKAGIALLVKDILEDHPDPYRHFTREAWAIRARAAAARVESLSATAYYAELAALAGMAGDVHTSVYPRRGSRVMRLSYGLRFWRFEDGVFVRAASPELTELVGARVTALQNIPMNDAWKRLLHMLPTENVWMSTYMAQVHMQFPAYLHALGLGGSDDGGQMTFLLTSGESRTIALTPTDSSGYLGSLGTSTGFTAPAGWIQDHDALSAPPRWLARRDRNYWYEPIVGTDAVFLQFNVPRSSGEPWRKFLEEVFLTIEERPDLERLVIDLRHNEGGWAYMAHALVHAIVASPKINRPGHLFVLTSRITQSAGVTIATKLDIETQAVFVGEPCGAHPNFFNGPLGNHPPRALPGSDIVFRVSTVREQNSDPLDDRCFIAPDIATPMTRADYAEGRDPALEAALTMTPSEAAHYFADPAGREMPVYFHWKRPSQDAARLH